MKLMKEKRKQISTNKKRILQAVFASTIFLGLTSMGIGCSNDLDKIVCSNEETLFDAGFIINGEERLPFYVRSCEMSEKLSDADNCFFSYKIGEVFSLDDKSFIGNLYMSDDYDFFPTTRNKFILDAENRILYSSEQIAFFNDCDSNLVFDSSLIQTLQERDYYFLEQLFLERYPFLQRNIDKYFMEDLATGIVKEIIGYPLSSSLFFNYETYRVENYSGYNITVDASFQSCLGDNEYNKTITYEEIFTILESEKDCSKSRR